MISCVEFAVSDPSIVVSYY